jgi:hypothetical protein
MMLVQAPREPRRVFYGNAGRFRDRELADGVAAGRFTHIGVTLELGVEPDWLTEPLPQDIEWRMEWSKFGYGRQLGRAFCDTSDEKYLRTWERLVRSWIAQVPIDRDDSYVTARRIQNWLQAWSLFSESQAFQGFSDGFGDLLFKSLGAQVMHLRDHLSPERNHRTLELFALFLAAVALPELDGGGDLRRFALSALHENLLTDVLADGVHRERSTHYHYLTLRTYLAVRENVRRHALELSKAFDERLERACEFAMHCHRPDGAIPALSDADTVRYEGLLELAADLLERPEFRFAATAGAQGTPPGRRHADFPEGGYFIQRSGWGHDPDSFARARFLVFDCGPLGDYGHGHYDVLSVEIAADGRPLIVDPGRYTYSEAPPNWRRWFRGTAAHNTVCVDGLDQTPYERTRPSGATAEGSFLGRSSAQGLDVLAGEARSPVYDAVHTRRIAFVADTFWIIADQLHAGTAHRYDLRFHLAADAEGQTTVTAGEVNSVVRAPGLVLVFSPARVPKIEAGWVAPSYGVKLPAPVVSVAVDGVAATTFFTLVVPAASSDPDPELRVGAHASTGDVVLDITRVAADGRDRHRVLWGAAPKLLATAAGEP